VILVVVAIIILVPATVAVQRRGLLLLRRSLRLVSGTDYGRMLVTVAGSMAMHTAQIGFYATASLVLGQWARIDGFGPKAPTAFGDAMYFSTETFTSVGFRRQLKNLWLSLA